MFSSLFVQGKVVDSKTSYKITAAPQFICEYAGMIYASTDSAKDVFVRDNYAFVADFGLKIFDISKPSQTSLVKHYDFGVFAENVFISGENAYVSSIFSGLKILNISDLKNPSQVGEFLETDFAIDTFIVDSYAFVADYYDGIVIIDVSDPTAPVEVSRYNDARVTQGLYTKDHYVYVGYMGGDFDIFDIADINYPSRVGQCDIGVNALAVSVVGNFAYVTHSNGLKIIDVSNPNSPSVVSSVLTGHSTDVQVIDGIAYVASASGLCAIDVNTPTSPSILVNNTEMGSTNGLFVLGTYAYLATDTSTLHIFRVGKDADGDNLTDYEETYTYNTDPYDIDSDNDGLSDGDEVFVYGTNPAKRDTDGDWISDSKEIELGFDPNDRNDHPTNYLLIGLIVGGGILTIITIVVLIFVRKNKTFVERSKQKTALKNQKKQQGLLEKRLLSEAEELLAKGELDVASTKLQEILQINNANKKAQKHMTSIALLLKKQSFLEENLLKLQPEVQVSLERIAEISNLTLIECKGLLVSFLQQKPEFGKYLEIEQVFIRSKPFGTSEPTTKKFTCHNCGMPVEKEATICPDCSMELIRCPICKLPVSFGDVIGSCSLCEAKGHLVHFQEWVKTQGKCPVCLQSLPLEGIVPEEVSQAKKE